MLNLTENERQWLQRHNKCYFYKNSLIILVTCKHLKRKNNRYICDIHNTAAYPEVCKNAGCLRNTDKEEVEFVTRIMKDRQK